MVVVLSYSLLFLLSICLVQAHRNKVARKQVRELEEKISFSAKELVEEQIARRILAHELEGARGLEQRTKELIEATKHQLSDRFEAISHDTFCRSQRSFFDMAKQNFEQHHTMMVTSMNKRHDEASSVLAPLKGSLEKMEKKVQDLEVSRQGAYEGVHQQLQKLSETQLLLHKETNNLASALREPTVRGRWGEIQLRRVVEIAGMLSYCDFDEQVSTGSHEGSVRPDMVVRLPNERIVVIDSKVSLSGYLDAVQAKDEGIRKEKLMQHAKFVRQHVVRLSQKKYWQQFSKTPDFVILFLHGECFLSPALEYDKELLEFASSQKVLIATPTSLIAMLKVIAYSWGEAKIEQDAQLILKEAKAWLERCSIFTDHFCDIGKHLKRTVEAYDKAGASFENRLLVSVRRLASSGLSSSPMEAPQALRQFPVYGNRNEVAVASETPLEGKSSRTT